MYSKLFCQRHSSLNTHGGIFQKSWAQPLLSLESVEVPQVLVGGELNQYGVVWKNPAQSGSWQCEQIGIGSDTEIVTQTFSMPASHILSIPLGSELTESSVAKHGLRGRECQYRKKEEHPNFLPPLCPLSGGNFTAELPFYLLSCHLTLQDLLGQSIASNSAHCA